MKYSRPSADHKKRAGQYVYTSCISCGNKTTEVDNICGDCDLIYPEYLGEEQYDNYFKLLGKKNDNIRKK